MPEMLLNDTAWLRGPLFVLLISGVKKQQTKAVV